MIEKRWIAVPPQLFASNGTIDGILTIADCSLFKVKQQVRLRSNTQPQTTLEVKRILGHNTIHVGEIGEKITQRSDISAFLVADGATIEADEQNRSAVPVQEIERLTYEEEAVVARRVILVDKYGDKYDGTNRLPVDANVVIGTISNPLIQNLPVPLASTEYSITYPVGTRTFMLKVRSGTSRIQFSYLPGQSNTSFISISSSGYYREEGLNGSSITIYFQCDKPNQIIETLSWS